VTSQPSTPHPRITPPHAPLPQSTLQSAGEHAIGAASRTVPQLSTPLQTTSHVVAFEQLTPPAQLDMPAHSTRHGMFSGHTTCEKQLIASVHSMTHTPVWHTPPAAMHGSSSQRGTGVPPVPEDVTPPPGPVVALPPVPFVVAPPPSPLPAVSSGGMQAESAVARVAARKKRIRSMPAAYMIGRRSARARARDICFHSGGAVVGSDLLYHPFYCEENVFHLCGHAALAGRKRHAVVISGELGGFVMWHQRAARGRAAPLFWDYHVILVAEGPCEVWDLDTTLGLPLAAIEYLRRSFRAGLPRELLPLFRVVPADVFVATLASDRSHMRRPDGRFERPPPPWPTVSPPERGSNLRRFVDMSDRFVGDVLSLEEMAAWVAATSSR
jgi:hypothetical protein